MMAFSSLSSWDMSSTPSRCFTQLKRRVWTPYRVVLRVMLIFGIISIGWLFFAVPKSARNNHDKDIRRIAYDSGIKLTRLLPRSTQPANVHIRHMGFKINNTNGRLDINNEAKKNSQSGSVHNDTIQRERKVDSNTKANPRTDSFPPWCSGKMDIKAIPKQEQNTREVKYFLTGVLLIRIYSYDPAKLTTDEMMQWLQYLSYAGVEHVYIYDAYLYKNESQRELLGCFIRNGFVTYVDWSHRARPEYTIAGTQVAAYQDCLNRYGAASVWQTAIDIDEYPFCHGDREAGFLARAVSEISRTRPNIGEISMQNYLYLQKPLDKNDHPLLIDRIWRRTKTRANPLVKPIYQPKAIQQANVHHNSLKVAFVNYSPSEDIIRMSHFWGGRLQEWGEDTPKVLAITEEDRGMERAVEALKPCVKGCHVGCCHN